jgi:hypothetical protein
VFFSGTSLESLELRETGTRFSSSNGRKQVASLVDAGHLRKEADVYQVAYRTSE